jgi:oxygen-independent coproporphyrinogen-3 oxidase
MTAPVATCPSRRASIVVPGADLITKYNRPGPRYTSYPPAPYWSGAYGREDYARALGEMGGRIASDRGGDGEGASLYVHIPFCEHRCSFCACNVIISRAHDRGVPYVSRVIREMDRVRAGIGAPRPRVRQIHWGGGTPTWLSAGELAQLQDAIAERFDLTPDREQSIEIDPRVTTLDQLAALRERGLNRVSIGVQDIDPTVQEAIHRIQPIEVTARAIDSARALGIVGVNVDLIYGLPHQNPESFGRTVDAVIALGVDRIALYNFAYFPDRLTHHTAIRPETLPAPETRIELFRGAAARFAAAGYEMIGLDHFAKSTDELAIAAREGTMQRNFMGYTTRAGSDLLAFGVSSISRVGRDFAQNVKTTADYERIMDTDGALPIERGLRLSDDDLLRESLIQRLMCYGQVDFAALETEHGVDLLGDERTARKLDELLGDGLIDLTDRRLRITDLGRFFLRNIAMVFDAYLGKPSSEAPSNGRDDKPVQLRFSRTV